VSLPGVQPAAKGDSEADRSFGVEVGRLHGVVLDLAKPAEAIDRAIMGRNREIPSCRRWATGEPRAGHQRPLAEVQHRVTTDGLDDPREPAMVEKIMTQRTD